MSESGWYCASEILRKIWQLTRFDPLEPSAEGHWSIPVYCHANRWIIGAIATSKPIHIRNPNAAKRNVLCERLESQSALVTCVFTKCFFQVFLVFLVLRNPPYCQHRDFVKTRGNVAEDYIKCSNVHNCHRQCDLGYYCGKVPQLSGVYSEIS